MEDDTTKDERIRYDRIRSAIRCGAGLRYGDMFFLKRIIKDLPVRDINAFTRFCNMNEVNILAGKPLQELNNWPFLTEEIVE